jgi:hypothetical protein
MHPDDGLPPGEEEFGAELDLWEASLADGEQNSLTDLVNRVLDKGVVITGNITISVAGIDLIYLGLSAVLTSISGARRRIRESVAAADGDEAGEG